MRRILFIIPSFMHGGTNRSFCNIIDVFGFKAHEILADVLCIKEHNVGVYLQEYKARCVSVLPENKFLSLPFYQGKNIFRKVMKKAFYCLPNIIKKTYLKQTSKRYGNLYDIVISMQEGISTEIASYIEAPSHCSWLRCIYEPYYFNNSELDEKPYYDVMDTIVCVSEACKKSLEKIYPQYSKKTVCIKNTQNITAILEKAKEKCDVLFLPENFNIVSVGRLDKVKQFHLIPKIAQRIAEHNGNLKWYIIGDGQEKDVIQEQICACGVGDIVCLVGSKMNPYPIISKANLVAVTSLSESFCNVIAEAEILDVPVISTPFDASYEAMRNKDGGIVCKIDDFPDNIMNIFHNYKEFKVSKGYNIARFYHNEEIEFVKKLEEVLCR